MRKIRRPSSILVLVLLILAVISGIVFALRQAPHAPPFKIARVERGSITVVVSDTGTLQALTTFEVKSNVGGTLTYLGVEEGDTVRAGQILARIDPSDAQSTLDQSRADLVSARSKEMQAKQTLLMQRVQNMAQVSSAEQAVSAAREKLSQAQAQAKLQPELTLMAIAQAKSALSAANIAYEQTKNSVVPQAISSAQMDLDQSRANYIYAQNDLARQKKLYAQGFVSLSEVDAAVQRCDVAKAAQVNALAKYNTTAEQTKNDLSTAKANQDQAQYALNTALANRVQDSIKQKDAVSARAALQQALSELENARANMYQNEIKQGDITQAAAQVTRSDAAVTNAVINLNYTTITSPRSGVVVKKYVEVGSVVAGGRQSLGGSGSGVTLMDIADVSRMFALVDVDETDIAKIKVGQNVDVCVDAFPDKHFAGKVIKIAPQTTTTQNVTTIPVTVEIKSPTRKLKPGMNATCNFIVTKHTDVLIVPNSAVKQTPQGDIVMTLDHGMPQPHKVFTGLSDDNNTEILDGLQQGDQVVTDMGVLPSGGDSSSNKNSQSSGGGPGPGGPPPPF